MKFLGTFGGGGGGGAGGVKGPRGGGAKGAKKGSGVFKGTLAGQLGRMRTTARGGVKGVAANAVKKGYIGPKAGKALTAR